VTDNHCTSSGLILGDAAMNKNHAVAVLFLLAFFSARLSSQSISIPLRLADNGGHFDTLRFGQDPVATYCVDPAFGEEEIPPPPPTGYFDVRWVESREGSLCFGQG